MKRTRVVVVLAVLSVAACSSQADRVAFCKKDALLAKDPEAQQMRYENCVVSGDHIDIDWGGLAGAVGNGLANYSDQQQRAFDQQQRDNRPVTCDSTVIGNTVSTTCY